MGTFEKFQISTVSAHYSSSHIPTPYKSSAAAGAPGIAAPCASMSPLRFRALAQARGQWCANPEDTLRSCSSSQTLSRCQHSTVGYVAS